MRNRGRNERIVCLFHKGIIIIPCIQFFEPANEVGIPKHDRKRPVLIGFRELIHVPPKCRLVLENKRIANDIIDRDAFFFQEISCLIAEIALLQCINHEPLF